MPAHLIDVIIRHPKERKSKCSVEPLKGRADILFYNATKGFTFDATGYVLLTPDAPVLGESDGLSPLLLLDSTWRLLPDLEKTVVGVPLLRSLPHFIKTAYPRHSKVTQDPVRGLATVEALYSARFLANRNADGLLDKYHWREGFLKQFTDL
jgi:pre-rRNA-processing protein TSR3